MYFKNTPRPALLAALGLGLLTAGPNALAWNNGAPKYLLAWMSDQYMDGNNHNPLDGILGLPPGQCC